MPDAAWVRAGGQPGVRAVPGPAAELVAERKGMEMTWSVALADQAELGQADFEQHPGSDFHSHLTEPAEDMSVRMDVMAVAKLQ